MKTRMITRREWMVAGASALALYAGTVSMRGWAHLRDGLVPAPAQADPVGASSDGVLRIGVIGGGGSASWDEGVRLGVEEAAQTGSLLGLRVEAVYAPLDAEKPGDARAALAGLLDSDVDVVIASLPTNGWTELEEAAKSRHVFLMDARPLRTGALHCSPLVFRLGFPTFGTGSRVPTAFGSAASVPGLDDTVIPGDVLAGVPAAWGPSAESEALAPAQSGSAAAEHESEGGDELVAWHESLDRFGAQQLNERFRAHFARGMDGAAWTSWFGVKVLVEAALRTGSQNPTVLAGYLLADGTSFDGHKGQPLRFRSEDHQLMHPLYTPEASGQWSEFPWPWSPFGERCGSQKP
jgi:hypothetical protein